MILTEGRFVQEIANRVFGGPQVQRDSFEKLPPIMCQLLDRLPHVVQCRVRRGLVDTCKYRRSPPSGQFLDRADVEIPVVKIALEDRHFASKESPILANTVAAHRGHTSPDMVCEECQRLRLGIRDAVPAAPDSFDQARLPVRPSIPIIHPFEHRVRLVHGDDRTLGDDVQFCIRYDRGNLNDVVVCRVETRHLQVDPDQVVVCRHVVNHPAPPALD